MCEGDGECSTDDSLDNCQEYEVYRKICDARPGPFAAVDLSATFTAPAFADIDGDGLKLHFWI